MSLILLYNFIFFNCFEKNRCLRQRFHKLKTSIKRIQCRWIVILRYATDEEKKKLQNGIHKVVSLIGKGKERKEDHEK